MINSIYTTISNGKVHIAADADYIGSVDTYNSCFTQFFAWLFGYSMTVNFDGKIRSVNKESYRDLIKFIDQNVVIDDIRKFSIFKPIAESVELPIGLKMRDVIAITDRKVLFQKLAVAISYGDTAKAMSMIGKGADVDIPYYDREGLYPSFFDDDSGLHQDPYEFTVFKATPLLQAARKSNRQVLQFLKAVGANESITGKQYTFKRIITHITRHLEQVLEPRSVPHHHHVQFPDGHVHERIENKTEYVPVLRERTVVHTQDSRLNERIIHFNTLNPI